MADRRRDGRNGNSGQAVLERIIDTDVSHGMQISFLEDAYSVLHTRALPDARNGGVVLRAAVAAIAGQLRPQAAATADGRARRNG